MRDSFIFLSYFLLFSSCTATSKTVSKSTPTSLISQINLFKNNTCKTDADCVLVDKGCCGCSSGGESIAIHISEKENYNSQLKKKCQQIEKTTDSIACHDTMMCEHFRAQCIYSQCITKKCANPCPIDNTPQ